MSEIVKGVIVIGGIIILYIDLGYHFYIIIRDAINWVKERKKNHEKEL